jgi:cell division protein FtsQ
MIGAWMVETNYPSKVANSLMASLDNSLKSSGLVVKTIGIEGAVKTKTAEIINALGVKNGQSILGQSLNKARRKVEQLDWVRSAIVMRQLPTRLKLLIQEREPVAIWQYREKHYLIDADGAVITGQGIEEYVHLPVIVGNGAAEKAPMILHLLSMYPNVQEHMRAIVYINKHRWDIWTVNNVTIKLPEQKLEAALKRLDKMLASGKYLSEDVKVIDLRLPSKAVIRADSANNWLKKRKVKKA